MSAYPLHIPSSYNSRKVGLFVIRQDNDGKLFDTLFKDYSFHRSASGKIVITYYSINSTYEVLMERCDAFIKATLA